jgi:peptide deformylase
MEKTQIRIYPDPVLRQVAEPVTDIDARIQQIIDQMFSAMYGTPNGIGLAANQIGVKKRVAVFDFKRTKQKEGSPLVVINPEIVWSDGTITREEACLSIPGFSAKVTRKKKVGVKGYDRQGKPIEIEAEDIEAICFQHEIDHLNGILFIDHISSLKRAIFKRKMKKMLREMKRKADV